MEAVKELEEVVQVKCPCCNLRLFDMGRDNSGIISIKCPRCGEIVSVSMHRKKYRCRKQTATRK